MRAYPIGSLRCLESEGARCFDPRAAFRSRESTSLLVGVTRHSRSIGTAASATATSCAMCSRRWCGPASDALENPPGIDAELTISVGALVTVADEPAGVGEIAPFVDRGHAMARRQRHKQAASAEKASEATTSAPSRMQDRGRSRATVSTMSSSCRSRPYLKLCASCAPLAA
jgi:hypothetical protein